MPSEGSHLTPDRRQAKSRRLGLLATDTLLKQLVAVQALVEAGGDRGPHLPQNREQQLVRILWM